MTKDGHVRLKRWCDPGDNQEDCYDLTDYDNLVDDDNCEVMECVVCSCTE